MNRKKNAVLVSFAYIFNRMEHFYFTHLPKIVGTCFSLKQCIFSFVWNCPFSSALFHLTFIHTKFFFKCHLIAPFALFIMIRNYYTEILPFMASFFVRRIVFSVFCYSFEVKFYGNYTCVPLFPFAKLILTPQFSQFYSFCSFTPSKTFVYLVLFCEIINAEEEKQQQQPKRASEAMKIENSSSRSCI